MSKSCCSIKIRCNSYQSWQKLGIIFSFFYIVCSYICTRLYCYTADSEKDPTATKFDEISYEEVHKRGLKVMDLTATAMCMENDLPIVVFNMDIYGNLLKVVKGEDIGTYVHN